MAETTKRVLTGMAYIGLLVASIMGAKDFFAWLFFVFMLIAAYEFSYMLKANLVSTMATALIFGGILTAVRPSVVLTSMYVLCVVFLTHLAVQMYRNVPYTYNSSIFKYLHIIFYIVVPFASIIALNIQVDNYQVMLCYFIIIWVNDSFAYIFGRRFGKRKLFEKVSPKKTIEGFVGGLIMAILTGGLLYIWHQSYSVVYWIFIAAFIAIVGTIGDLVESKFKRQANIKDSGTIMPGHGGILDRLDSFLYIAPFILLTNILIHYVS